MKEDKTGELLYTHMVIEGMSIIWISKEYGVSKHYVVRKVHKFIETKLAKVID